MYIRTISILILLMYLDFWWNEVRLFYLYKIYLCVIESNWYPLPSSSASASASASSSASSSASASGSGASKDISTPEECARNCQDNEPPRTCYYHFVLELYTSNGAYVSYTRALIIVYVTI